MQRANSPDHSPSIFARAEQVLPGGGFGNFDPGIFIARGKGSRVWDTDGKEYVDFLIGSGPMLIGHCHPEVVDVVNRQMLSGQTFFANNPQGLELAEEIVASVACAGQVRFVSTGGEADMYAMRLARAFTGRDKIMKFEGGYHGMSGEALMSLFPTAPADYPHAIPDSAGIPSSVRDGMLIAPYNDSDYALDLIEKNASEIACVIVEPLQRIVPPVPGFLEALREATRKHGIVLIFDEVVTGYRLAYGGAQEHYNVVPDLCTLGKIIGGGLPLAAVAGSPDIMMHFDKARAGADKFTLQIGTLSGNPLASAAGLKTMEILRRPGVYETIRAHGRRIISALREHLSAAGVPHQVVGDPVLFDVVFTDSPVVDYRGTISGDASLERRFNQLMREQGILKPATKFYVSCALTDKDMEQTLAAIKYSAEHLLSA